MADNRPITLEEGNKRAIEDYSQSGQFARGAIQITFVANGGVALAMLSCLTALITSDAAPKAVSLANIINHFALAAAFYLLGVVSVSVASAAYARSKLNWGHHWEKAALKGQTDFSGYWGSRGDRSETIGNWSLRVGIAFFLAGSITAILGFAVP